ncbi:MAG: hypothetical protein U0Q12_16025 [Vicinamibacterales bacterium]
MNRTIVGLARVAAVAGLLATGALGALQAQAPTAPAAPKRMVPPVRGTAQIGYLKPKVDHVKDLVITKMTIKNLSKAPIAGLKVDEFWYDKAGNTLPSDSQRLKKPLQPGEVVEITLQTPYNKAMNSNKYNFSHANGDVKATLLKALDEVPTTN